MSERANYECGCGQDIENNSPYPFFTAGNCSLAVVRAIFQRKIYANSLTVSAIGQALPSSVQTSFMKVPKQKLPAISLQCRSNQLKIHFRFDHSSSIFCLYLSYSKSDGENSAELTSSFTSTTQPSGDWSECLFQQAARWQSSYMRCRRRVRRNLCHHFSSLEGIEGIKRESVVHMHIHPSSE